MMRHFTSRKQAVLLDQFHANFMTTPNALTPWYKQFWPWFVISIPILTIISGISMLVIASYKPDSIVRDDYYKSGLAINKTIARDKRALALGQRAKLLLDADNKRIVLTLSGKEHPASLSLQLTHPTVKEQDITLNLRQENNKEKYSAALASLPRGKRYLLLEPKDRSWRLVGSGVLPNKEAIALNPDL